jgi:CheY-like chemotaxis protein
MPKTALQTILIVEDSDDDFIAIARVFKKACLRNPVQRCSNGEQALDYLYRRREFAAPDGALRPGMILLDLNMHGTDGRDVLRAVKSDSSLQQIPVIVLTTSYARQDITRCYDYGADSYLLKPVSMDEFIKSIERLKESWQGVFDIDLDQSGQVQADQ